MMSKLTSLFLAGSLFCVAEAHAVDATSPSPSATVPPAGAPASAKPPTYDIEQVWDLVLRNNSELSAKRATIEQKDLAAAAARAEYSVDVALAGRAATEDTERDDSGSNNRSDNSLDDRYYGELSATLPFFHKAPKAMEARQARLDAGLARTDYANTVRSLELDVLRAYLDVVVYQRILWIKREAANTAGERSRAAEEGYRLGRLAQKDQLSERAYLLEKQIAASRASNDLAEKRQAVVDFAGGTLPPDWNPVADSVSAKVADEAKLSALPPSDWLFQDNALSNLRSQMEMKKQGWWFEPRLSLKGYGFSGDNGDGDESGYGGAVGLQIPFPNIALTSRNKRLAEAEHAEVERQLADERRWYEQEVRRSTANATGLRSVVDSLTAGVGVKRSEYEIALRDVSLGRLTRPQLQGLQDELIEWRSDLESARADHLMARARLQYLLTGQVLGSTQEVEAEMIEDLKGDRVLRRMIRSEPALVDAPGPADTKP
jgi:outer membrane protein TolC